MIITQQMMNNKLTLTLSGRFEYHDRKPFQEAIRQVQATNHRDIILNFAQVQFIDSGALGLLAVTHQNLKLSQQQLILLAPQENVLKVFNLVNIQKMIPIGATEEEARKNFASV